MSFDFDRHLLHSLPELQRFARRLTRDPVQADDLLQDCVERALRNRDKFEPGTNLEAWLVTIMKNLHYTQHQRARRVCQTEITEDVASTAPAQVWPIMVRETGEAIERLTPNHRQLIRIVAIDGLSYEEAATELGVSIGTVRSRLSRARAELRAGDAPRPEPTVEQPTSSVPEPAMAAAPPAACEPVMAPASITEPPTEPPTEPTTAPAAAPAAATSIPAAAAPASGVRAVLRTSFRRTASRAGRTGGVRLVGQRRPASRPSLGSCAGRRIPLRAPPVHGVAEAGRCCPGLPWSRDGPSAADGTAPAAVPRRVRFIHAPLWACGVRRR